MLFSPMVIHYILVGVTTALVSLVGWNVRIGFKLAADKLAEAQAKLASIEETTKVQASNHLHHLEEEAYKHTAALDKQTTILERIESQGVSTAAKFDTLIAVMSK